MPGVLRDIIFRLGLGFGIECHIVSCNNHILRILWITTSRQNFETY